MLLSTDVRGPTHLGRPQPWLICLDLQREYVVPGRPNYTEAAGRVARMAERMLAHARRLGWRVVHSQVPPKTPGAGHFGAPIEGLRPLISEPVFVRQGLSAFSDPDFAAALRQARGEDVYMIGFAFNGSCLATVLSAFDLGLCVTVVEDAVGAAPRENLPAATARQYAAALLRPYSRLLGSDEVVEETEDVIPA